MKYFLAIVTALTLSFAAAQDFEVGVAFDQGFTDPAVFIYVTEDFFLGEIGFIDSQLWFSPSAEIVIRRPLSGFVQAQVLLDTPPFTLSARAKYEFDQQFEIRVGVLFEL